MNVSRTDRPLPGALTTAYWAGHVQGLLGRCGCPYPAKSVLGVRWHLGNLRGREERINMASTKLGLETITVRSYESGARPVSRPAELWMLHFEIEREKSCG